MRVNEQVHYLLFTGIVFKVSYCMPKYKFQPTINNLVIFLIWPRCVILETLLLLDTHSMV